jgi:hypothetical protein
MHATIAGVNIWKNYTGVLQFKAKVKDAFFEINRLLASGYYVTQAHALITICTAFFGPNCEQLDTTEIIKYYHNTALEINSSIHDPNYIHVNSTSSFQ